MVNGVGRGLVSDHCPRKETISLTLRSVHSEKKSKKVGHDLFLQIVKIWDIVFFSLTFVVGQGELLKILKIRRRLIANECSNFSQLSALELIKWETSNMQ